MMLSTWPGLSEDEALSSVTAQLVHPSRHDQSMMMMNNGVSKSTLSKSMQPSIYPVGRRWTFSTSQVYTAESIRTAMLMIFTVV